jgi:hypothetical protein
VEGQAHCSVEVRPSRHTSMDLSRHSVGTPRVPNTPVRLGFGWPTRRPRRAWHYRIPSAAQLPSTMPREIKRSISSRLSAAAKSSKRHHSPSRNQNVRGLISLAARRPYRRPPGIRLGIEQPQSRPRTGEREVPRSRGEGDDRLLAPHVPSRWHSLALLHSVGEGQTYGQTHMGLTEGRRRPTWHSPVRQIILSRAKSTTPEKKSGLRPPASDMGPGSLGTPCDGPAPWRETRLSSRSRNIPLPGDRATRATASARPRATVALPCHPVSQNLPSRGPGGRVRARITVPFVSDRLPGGDAEKKKRERPEERKTPSGHLLSFITNRHHPRDMFFGSASREVCKGPM